jgi:hypothetical protein
MTEPDFIQERVGQTEITVMTQKVNSASEPEEGKSGPRTPCRASRRRLTPIRS